MRKPKRPVHPALIFWDDPGTMEVCGGGTPGPAGGVGVMEAEEPDRGATPAWMFEAALFTDGGTLGANPSRRGGTWAWVVVDPYRDIRADSDCGTVVQKDFDSPPEFVTNNTSELLAAVLGMRALPDGWEGAVYSDSQTTLQRLAKARSGKIAKMAGAPADLVEELYRHAARFGQFRSVLLAGHPTREDLLYCQTQMVYRDPASGRLYSRHNHHADKLCCGVARDCGF